MLKWPVFFLKNCFSQEQILKGVSLHFHLTKEYEISSVEERYLVGMPTLWASKAFHIFCYLFFVSKIYPLIIKKWKKIKLLAICSNISCLTQLNNKKLKRLENSQLLRKTWQVNQIFELILEQCVANYYRDNTIAKWFLNFPRLIFFYWSPCYYPSKTVQWTLL